ncbi:hypothetical protein V1509DRAFT_496762 [Lipomyces kononenkoae]
MLRQRCHLSLCSSDTLDLRFLSVQIWQSILAARALCGFCCELVAGCDLLFYEPDTLVSFFLSLPCFLVILYYAIFFVGLGLRFCFGFALFCCATKWTFGRHGLSSFPKPRTQS